MKKNLFKNKENREAKEDETSQSITVGNSGQDDAKAGTSREGDPAILSAVVEISSAEEVCTPGTRNEKKRVLGKRNRAATFPGATSQVSPVSSGDRSPPQARRKVETKKPRKRVCLGR